MKRCSVDTLAFEGPAGCPSGSKAGPDRLGNRAARRRPAAPLNFDVSPFVLDNNTLVFYVASEAGTGIAVQSPITGEITGKGRKLRIRIPQELRQPVPGVDASLTGLNQTFKGKRQEELRRLEHRLQEQASTSSRGTLTFTERARPGSGAAARLDRDQHRCKK